MTDRTCEKCQKVFSVPTQLRRHLKRKTPCGLVLAAPAAAPAAAVVPAPAALAANPKVPCPHCNRLYASRRSMRQHVLHKCKAAPTKNTVERLQKQHDMLQKQHTELKKDIEELRTAVAAPTTNYVAITLVLNNFAKEDTDHLTEADVRAILNSCVDIDPEPAPAVAAQAVVAALGRAIFANPECEENFTACLVNRKAENGCVFRDGDWKTGPATIIQQGMATKIIEFYQAQTFATWRKFDSITNYLTRHRMEILTNNQLRAVLLQTGKLLQARDPKMMEDLMKRFKTAQA